MRVSKPVFFLAFLAGSAPSLAHDLWIEPSSFGPLPGQKIAIRLRVGQQFVGDPLPRSSELLKEFVIAGPDGTKPVEGAEGGDPAGYIRAGAPGAHMLGYHSHPFRVDVDPVKFEAYLGEEGLDSIAFLRQHEGTTGEPGREKFSRCAKALIAVGTGQDHVSARALGFTAELVPEIDSFPLVLGDTLRVQFLFEGKPYSGALVSAFSKAHPDVKQSKRSDTSGHASFLLDRPGVWLVKTVQMIPGDGEVDWESFWASLTFEVQGE